MTKELQNLVWSILPKEFKEEVKKEWQTANNEERLPHDAFLRGCYSTMILLFGTHNLTSDVEEEEMLTVSRKRVQEMFTEAQKAIPICEHDRGFRNAELTILRNLFGPKCLPDETLSQNPPENCDTENHISTDCDKAAEPRFKVGDVVRIKPNVADYHQGYQNGYAWLPERNKYVGKVFSIINVWPSGTIVLNIPDNVYWEAIDLEPYTEPTEKNPKESDETFASDSERRLNIAATILAGIVAREAPARHPVKRALELTDALIAEAAKKGGTK